MNGGVLPFGLTEYIAKPGSIAAWGPFVAALLSALIVDGWDKLLTLVKRGIQFRFALSYYVMIILVFPILIGGAMAISMLTGQEMPASEGLAAPGVLPIAFIYILFLGGPLQEEFGWRGVLMPKFLDRMGPVLSSVIIGLIWGLWHLRYSSCQVRPFIMSARFGGLCYRRH